MRKCLKLHVINTFCTIIDFVDEPRRFLNLNIPRFTSLSVIHVDRRSVESVYILGVVSDVDVGS